MSPSATLSPTFTVGAYVSPVSPLNGKSTTVSTKCLLPPASVTVTPLSVTFETTPVAGDFSVPSLRP